jgi:MFS family permease
MTRKRWQVLALLGTAFFMTILDGTSLLSALPSIERDLGLHGPAIQWTVTAYALAFSGLLLLSGRAADLLGRRKVFLAGMVLRVLSSLLCGLAPSLEVLVAARALQGVSAAIIAPAALSMVMNAFAEGPERNKALGVWGGLGGFGATAGLLLGGLITDTLGWQWGSAAPLLPFRLLRSRVLVGGNLLLLIAGMAVDGMLITLTSHVQQVLGSRKRVRWGPGVVPAACGRTERSGYRADSSSAA